MKPVSVTSLFYMSAAFNCISRLLSRHSIKSWSLPQKKMHSFLQPVKDDLVLKTPDMYGVPCKYGQVYIRQAGDSIETRVKEQQHIICLQQPDISTMAKHNINLGHHIYLQNTNLCTESRYVELMIRVGTEMELHHNSMNREDGLCLSQSWKPLIPHSQRRQEVFDTTVPVLTWPLGQHTGLFRTLTWPQPATYLLSPNSHVISSVSLSVFSFLYLPSLFSFHLPSFLYVQ
jgi:hypothetical protein